MLHETHPKDEAMMKETLESASGARYPGWVDKKEGAPEVHKMH